ncbi:MAG TPA: hypothetical protein HPP56_02210 [Nitrospirae bacterium]|nr:hypothetical protein [Nitrospirota bacterium]
MLKILKIFFIRGRIKISHQPFLLCLVDFVKFSVLSLILGQLIVCYFDTPLNLPLKVG